MQTIVKTTGHMDISLSDRPNIFPCLIDVNSTNISRIWAIIKPKVTKALNHGIQNNDENYVYDQLLTGQARLWVNKDSWIISTFETLNIGKCITIWLASGDKHNLFAMYDVISKYAKQNGCKSMLINGRKGWVRFLKKHNFKPLSILRKEL